MLNAGDVIDRFEIVELLGVGGIAQVYKARHRVLGSMHALKVVTAGGPAVARRLLREGSIQAQLRHPNVVAVTDVIEVRGHSALVLEYVEGITLQGLLAEKGALVVDEALALFSQVLAGVAAAHAAGVLHRDLKPGNILLAPGPSGVLAKVTDFGLAKVLLADTPSGPGDTIQGLVMGTPGYMAPEQAGAASGADARADVFALGVILYEMLSGDAPFTRGEIAATLAATLLGDHTPLGIARPELAGPLVDTVERCLAVDRTARFDDARALARALYGDRPELAEVVDGRRLAAPLAISLPSLMPLRAAGVGSAAAGLANPTMAPSDLAELLADDPTEAVPSRTIVAEAESIGAGAGMGAGTVGFDAGAAGERASPVEEPAAPAGPAWLPVGIGMGLVLVMGVGAALWFGLPETPGAEPAPRVVVAGAGGAAIARGGAPVDAATSAGASATAPSTPGEPGTLPVPVTEGAGGGAIGAVGAGAGSGAPGTSGLPGGAGAPPDATGAPSNATAAVDPAGATDPTATDAPAVPVSATPTVATPAPDAPAVADASPPTAPEPPPEEGPSAGVARLAGTWQGTWAGRPFTVALDGSKGDRLSARLEVLVGTSYRTFRLGGTLDPATGRFTVSESTASGWWLDGTLVDGQLEGSMRVPDQKKGTGYTARRR